MFKPKIDTAKIKTFFSNRTNVVLTAVLLIIILGAGFGIQRFLSNQSSGPLQIVDLAFDPEGPYVLLIPRTDGNALTLQFMRGSAYDAFSYELTYQSVGVGGEEGTGLIDRGAGDLKTFIDLKGKSEFKQEILFGTCSKGNTADPLHCVFDKNVENGNLTIQVKDKNILYRLMTAWHMQKPDIALGKLTSPDGHFTYQINYDPNNIDIKQQLVSTSYSVIHDLSAAPKLPDNKEPLGKVYTLNVPTAKTLPQGVVNIELLNPPPANAQIARYNESENSWKQLDTKISDSSASAQVDGAGIFALLVDKKSQ